MSRVTEYYDKIYGFKDYQAEASKLCDLAHKYGKADGSRLLDVACGTGQHIAHLKHNFVVEGMDISEAMLAIARQRNPGVPLHLGDMMAFDLKSRFDVITCLFSSIGYTRTLGGFERAVRCMARHLAPGGLLVVEPWLTPEAWKPGTVHALMVDEPALKIARVNTSGVDGRLSFFDLHHLIGTSQGTEHVVERHELGLFTIDEMTAAFAAAGLTAEFDPVGLTGRGILLGLHPG